MSVCSIAMASTPAVRAYGQTSARGPTAVVRRTTPPRRAQTSTIGQSCLSWACRVDAIERIGGTFPCSRSRRGCVRQNKISQPLFHFLAHFFGTAHWRICFVSQGFTGREASARLQARSILHRCDVQLVPIRSESFTVVRFVHAVHP